jgi:hypothetical protein
MTHRCLISCEAYCEYRRLQQQLRSGVRTCEVTIMHVDADDNEIGEVTYRCSLYWEGSGWYVQDVEPAPPSEFVTDRVCEQAALLADEAVADALDEAAEHRGWE